MSVVLLGLVGLMIAIGAGLVVVMLRRDEPYVGMIGLMVLQGAGLPAAAYSVLYV